VRPTRATATPAPPAIKPERPLVNPITQTAEPHAAIAAGPPADLHRVIRVRDGLAVAVGMIIGAGILRTPGLIAGYVGNAWVILGVWVLGGIIAGLSTLLLAEMAAAIPNAGGKYVYARAAWGPVGGFVAGWNEMLTGRSFTGAAKAIVIATYIISLAGSGNLSVVAGVIVVAFTLLHLGGLKVGTRFQNITTVIKIVVLVAIAAAGIWGGDSRAFSEPMAVSPEYAGLLGFALAYQAVAFAYYGWEDAAKLAEEVRDPGRALPRILIGGASVVAAIYLLMNVAFLAALTPGEMAGSELVARDAIAGVFGTTAGQVVTVCSLLILISSLNVNFLATPRVAFALSRDGLAPKAFARVSPNGTPTAALLFIAALIFAGAVTGAFESLIRFMMLCAITVDGMVLLGFFRLRRHRPDLVRPLRVPGYPWLPALTIALYLAVLAIIVITQPRLAIGGAVMLGSLVVAGVIVTGRQKPRP
jgi:APA family basic amino acid/polyamine antiporter